MVWLSWAVMSSPRRLVQGNGRKGLAVAAQCAPTASFAHSRLPASRAGAIVPLLRLFRQPRVAAQDMARCSA